VIDVVDEQGEAEDVGQEDEFLTDGGGDLADGGEEGDSGGPFGGRETGFAGEGVQVCDEAGEDVAGARGGALGVYEVDVFGYVFDLGGRVSEGCWKGLVIEASLEKLRSVDDVVVRAGSGWRRGGAYCKILERRNAGSVGRHGGRCEEGVHRLL